MGVIVAMRTFSERKASPLVIASLSTDWWIVEAYSLAFV